MKLHTISQAGFRQSARYLLLMRLSMVTMEWLALAALSFLAPPMTGPAPLLVTLAHALFAAASWLWLTRHPPAHSLPVTLSLTADLVVMGIWLALTGGFTNPLVSLLLLPLVTGLVLVPTRHSLAITLVAIVVYTLLVLFPVPPPAGLSRSDYMQLHLMGMWGTFALTAAIMLVVVGSLVSRLREQQQALARDREERLRDEQIIALGLSAANVAHRLGTPLNTMTLLVDDMQTLPQAHEIREDLKLLEQQIGLCRDQLKTMTEAAVRAREAATETLPLGHWLQRLRESATLLWPDARIHWPRDLPDDPLQVDATLDQAVLNLLANALRASPGGIEVTADIVGPRVQVRITDHGTGISEQILGQRSHRPVNSDQGLGVGLFLSNATIQRLGGHLEADVRTGDENRGTTMIIDLPIAEEDHHE
ncbi:two-component system, sensor histidine kinase RegB [Marinobacter daqiaonensis]|uniref:histidine kinase n=1 Tax=Marinobacter daqiaonensis TaxID=650891 RepID=A0A1I6I766_9GAMM|nr:HAMP domain-containing sensor histidine kinase [Marinobacter daqiaonensis]SFR62499.1 two-component system, sensor histidine kinase RegB [Marinobacter daqiaonensis]